MDILTSKRATQHQNNWELRGSFMSVFFVCTIYKNKRHYTFSGVKFNLKICNRNDGRSTPQSILQ